MRRLILPCLPPLGAASGCGLWVPIAARAFPERERSISLSMGFAPGGSSGIAARLLSERFAHHIGGAARIVVENRPGASGTR